MVREAAPATAGGPARPASPAGTRRRAPRPRLPHALLGALVLAGAPSPAAPQDVRIEGTDTPEGAATLFLRSVRALRWDAAAQLLHHTALERFHTVVTLMVDADTTGAVRRFFTETEPDGYARLGAAEVFGRAVGATIDDLPGLMHALYDRDDEVMGHVPEGADTAHVVYRTTARLTGAVPEVKVMQLAWDPGGWRVLWSDELEVLDVALRGSARPRPPGGG